MEDDLPTSTWAATGKAAAAAEAAPASTKARLADHTGSRAEGRAAAWVLKSQNKHMHQ
jgi:hypothetical protein